MPMKAAIGTLFWPMKSDMASPIPVVRSFITQKITVISGTLVRSRRADAPAGSDPAVGRRTPPDPLCGELAMSDVTSHQQDRCARQQHSCVTAEHREANPGVQEVV